MTASMHAHAGDRWYAVDQVGVFVVNTDVATETLAPALARRYFAGEFLRNWVVPGDAERRRVRALAELIHQEPRLMTGGNPRPHAEVESFSHSRAILRVTLVLGSFRGHHYFYQLARYNVAREPAIDTVYELAELERRLSYTYRGLGHGSRSAEMFSRLSAPDAEYPGPTPSQRNLYFGAENLHVELHDGVVYYIEPGKPGWLEPMPPPAVMHGQVRAHR